MGRPRHRAAAAKSFIQGGYHPRCDDPLPAFWAVGMAFCLRARTLSNAAGGRSAHPRIGRGPVSFLSTLAALGFAAAIEGVL